MNIRSIELSIYAYEELFMSFVDAYQLPKNWFSSPDHFAIKCANQIDYLEVCDSMSASCHELWELEIDGRMLASAKLLGGVSISDCSFGWVEIMQPKSGKEQAAGFVEHTEFTVPDFYEVLRVLDLRGVEDVALQGNEGHSWINIPIDDHGREVKLNDEPLDALVAKEIEENKIHRIISNGY